MELDPVIRAEWHTAHALGRSSLAWIQAHADAGDLNPIPSAVAELRRLELEHDP